jgi:hypothetical protein
MLDTRNRHHPTKPEPSGLKCRLTARDLSLFERINWHGILPTAYLVEYFKRWGHSEGRARDRISDLGCETNTPHGGVYLIRPDAQFPPTTYIPRNFHLTHDLSPAAVAALQEVGKYAPATHGGWYDHQVMGACIGADIEMGAQAANIVYIPKHETLGNRSLSVKVPFTYRDPTGRQSGSFAKQYIPDDFFTLAYPNKRRHFIVEWDRSTEDVEHANFDRKSFLRTALQIRELIGGGLFREAYGLPVHEGMVALIFTTNENTAKRMLDLLLRLSDGKGNNFICIKVVPQYAGRKGFVAPKPDPATFTGPFRRAGKPDFYLTEG